MQLSWRDQEETTIFALLDTGATCALISTKFIEQYGTPSEMREILLSISTFDGATLPDAGKEIYASTEATPQRARGDGSL